MRTSARPLHLIILNAYWFGLSFMWNSLHPIVLPAVLLNYVPDARKNTYLGLLTFVGLIIAMVVQPISGALSDGWASRWGRRRPLIAIGTLFDFLFLAMLGWGGGLTWLFIGYIGLQFSSNVAHGPMQGLLPDQVPPERLGIGSAVKNFMDMLAVIVASLLAGRLIDPQTRDPRLIMSVVMALLAFFSAWTLLGVREQPTVRHGPRLDWRGLLSGLKVDFRENRAYWWLIAERGLFLLGFYGIQSFVQYYIKDVMQVENPAKVTGDLMASIGVTLVVLVLAGGWLSDRFGAKRVLLASSLLTAAGILGLSLVRTPDQLLIVGTLVGGGIGLFLTANWALATRLAPSDQAGKFLGLTNLATAGSAALSRLWGPIIDSLNALRPGAWLGYVAMFVFGALFILLSIPLLARIRTPEAK